MTQLEPMVSMGVRVRFTDWRRLVALAERRGLRRGDRPNVSEAAREVLALGLEVVNGEAAPEEVPPDD